MKALTIGHVTLDVYDNTLCPGGSVLYAARTWRALGMHPHIITAAGCDFTPGLALENISARIDPAPQTTRFTNRYTADGDRVQHLAAQAPPVPVPDILPSPELLFLAPVLGEVDAPSWLKAFHTAKIRAVGLQGWLKRAVDGKVIHGPHHCDPAQFRGADVAFLSDEDLAGRLDWLDALCAVVPLVYLTCGHRGCVIFQGDCTERLGVYPTSAVDPTGAGDTFAAATLFGLLNGETPLNAARLGAAAASVVVEYRAAAPIKALRRAPERMSGIR